MSPIVVTSLPGSTVLDVTNASLDVLLVLGTVGATGPHGKSVEENMHL